MNNKDEKTRCILIFFLNSFNWVQLVGTIKIEKKMSDDNKGRSTKLISWIFLGILGFVTIIFPFFMPNLRYQASILFSGVFENTIDTIGTICTTIGAFILVFGLLSLFCGRSGSGLKIMITGVFLLIIGTSLTGFNFFSFIEGPDAPSMSKGYE